VYHSSYIQETLKKIHFIAKLQLRFREELSGVFETLVTVFKAPNEYPFERRCRRLSVNRWVFYLQNFSKKHVTPSAVAPLGVYSRPT